MCKRDEGDTISFPGATPLPVAPPPFGQWTAHRSRAPSASTRCRFGTDARRRSVLIDAPRPRKEAAIRSWAPRQAIGSSACPWSLP